MKKKNISSLYNYALLAIIIAMIPIMDFNNVYMDVIVAIIGLVLCVDLFITLSNYMWFKREEKYINSLKKQIDSFYDMMHIHFGNNAKDYPDNSFDIAAATYRLLIDTTDINEYDYEMYITKGAVGDLGDPHYWITIFSNGDLDHEYPFIIDTNTIRYKANRESKFRDVLDENRAVILSCTSKEFKKYRPHVFMEIEESNNRAMRTRGNKIVYIATMSEKTLPKTDVRAIKSMMARRLKRDIDRLKWQKNLYYGATVNEEGKIIELNKTAND